MCLSFRDCDCTLSPAAVAKAIDYLAIYLDHKLLSFRDIFTLRLVNIVGHEFYLSFFPFSVVVKNNSC